jgi:hypothetical protein
MPENPPRPRVYDGDGDALMEHRADGAPDRVVLIPDALSSRVAERTPRIRVMWGQHLLEDLLAGRYRTLVCAVNATDNSHGIITHLANLLPTSQWSAGAIGSYAAQFSNAAGPIKVLKFDMDAVEVLAILRPQGRPNLTVTDLSSAFRLIAEMIRRNTARSPSASVSFLDARANVLVDANNKTPSFETILRTMYEAGFTGDVYPAPSMWKVAPTAVYARYPLPDSLKTLREGGF